MRFQEILDADFLGSLEGSDRLKELVLEPGNSYNAAVISKAKTLGQSVFAGLDSEERKRRINEQVRSLTQRLLIRLNWFCRHLSL